MAWHPLGWSPAFFSEIEKFPSAVLAHHYPHVSNLGDMTKFEEWPDETIDLLVGGTPCQSFSVAGLRKGLDDPRGNLMLTYLSIARRNKPRWLVWENVPGVLSSNGGRDFAALIRGLAELGYHAAWRVLDAEYVRTQSHPWAVPQRRRRVFVVGYLGDWRRPAAVLFDGQSLLRDSPPRRETGKAVAGTLNASAQGGGGLGDARGIAPAFAAERDVSGTVSAKWSKGSGGPAGDECQNLVAHTLRAEGFVADVTSTLPAGGNSTGGDRQPGTSAETAGSMLVAHTLRGEGFDASEDGSGRGTPIVPIQFECFGTAVQADQTGVSQTLRAMGGKDGHGGGGGHAAVALDLRGRGAEPWAVRRLTPRECERLQGFPDDFTAIPWRGKSAENCPDGPRYKALGNSMAVNAMRWIGDRIEQVDALGMAAE